ncbi:DUF3908 family protein [Bacillus mesophilum]|uniref:DUF3908 domain-containing protein n=1 Tax=Bacillus mesophilum TaxID=1071718 RepID=A0A7V7RPC7_9BACI|nr:DUF3908 family protein [Bacillus mesophilum]KAB2335073.1 DUF3908 domain-containing protein [Bacillus mesophilum]
MNESYTVEDFLDDLRKRDVPLPLSLTKMLPIQIEKSIDTEKVIAFYAKNMVKDFDEDKQFYFFLRDKLIELSIVNKQMQFKNINQPIFEITFIPAQNGTASAVLKLSFNNREDIIFNSLEDSNPMWNDTYINSLNEIYKTLT